MTLDQAENLAIRALQHLAGDHDLLGAFLAETGATPADLRRAAGSPAFLGAVLDFLLQDDRRVLDLAASLGILPEMVATARQALPGGAQFHWT